MAIERPRISWLISHLLSAKLLSKVSPARLLHALGLELAVAADSPQVPLSGEGVLRELTGGVALGDMDSDAYAQYVRSSRLVVRELQLAPGEQALILNGRVSISLPSRIVR